MGRGSSFGGGKHQRGWDPGRSMTLHHYQHARPAQHFKLCHGGYMTPRRCSLGAAMLQAFRAHLRPPCTCMGTASPACGLLLRNAALQLQPPTQQARPLRTLAAWRPAAALGCGASLRHAWPPAGAAPQLGGPPLGQPQLQLRGKGTQNAKKKKKLYKRAKRDAYRAEAAAISAAEVQDRQLALLSRVPPRALAVDPAAAAGSTAAGSARGGAGGRCRAGSRGRVQVPSPFYLHG
jgi:hypothetical protein